MSNTLAYCQEQILILNSRLINSEISLDEYHRNLETLFLGMSWQKRMLFDNLTFSSRIEEH